MFVTDELEHDTYLTYSVWLTSEPDYDFEKNLQDADAYEKETAEFECEVNDEEAPVQWFREDKVCATKSCCIKETHFAS